MTFQGSSRTHRRRRAAGAAAGSIILALAACSSGSDATSSGESGSGDVSASARACVDKATKYLDERGLLPETLPAGLTPLSKAPEEGITLTRLFPGAVPTSAALSKKIVEVAPVLGWTGKAVSYDGSVEDVNRKALAAIDNSDVVVIDGVDKAALQAPIKAAKDKGVLLMLGSIKDAPESYPGFSATPGGGSIPEDVGELAANIFMQKTKCQGKAAGFGLPVDALQSQAASMKSVLEKECDECSLSYTDIQFADIGSPAATNAIVSKLQSDSKLNFAYFTIGDLAVGLEPALQQAGIDVQIGGAIPVPSNLEALKAGKNEFWLGIPQGINAWLNIDTAARVLDTGKPVAGDIFPIPVFTTDNIESTDPIPSYPTDYEEQFKKLWQVG